MIRFQQVLNYLIIFPIIFATAKPALSEQKIPQQELLIWRVDPKPGNIYSVYILGSYHIGKDCEINSPAWEHAFKDAETVVFEVDSLNDKKAIEQKSLPYMSKLIQQKGIPANPEDSLQGTVDPQTYELLKEKAAAANFPIDSFARLKPWVFIFAFTSTQATQGEYKPECGLDLMNAKLAETENKDTAGLESLEYQLDMFTDLFISMDSEEITETILAIAEAESNEELSGYLDAEFDSLTSIVDSGNLAKLESTIEQWCSGEEEQCESLLYTRNRNWIPQIEDMLQQDRDSLVIVGAGHLAGKNSVIELLKERGYRVRRFYNNFRLSEE
ncbi:MAG: TraB/GumN family protein [Cyanobacteria bacterium J06600_6]